MRKLSVALACAVMMCGCASTPGRVDDPFECAWLRVAVAGLEGLFSPGTGAIVVEHAAARCPSDPRMTLAMAVVRDQQYSLTVEIRQPGDPVRPVTEAEQRVLDGYAAAFAAPATSQEARVRAVTGRRLEVDVRVETRRHREGWAVCAG